MLYSMTETIKANLELGIVSFSGFTIKTKIEKGEEKKILKIFLLGNKLINITA